MSSKKEFKVRWNENEIFEFNDKLRNMITTNYTKNNNSNNTHNRYDCLLYFISCHGDTGGVIYDSQGNKLPLITIFDTFSNQNCIELRDKPKIYFIEACRGNIRTKRYQNSMYKPKSTVTSNNGLQLLQSETPIAVTPPPASNCYNFDRDEKKSENFELNVKDATFKKLDNIFSNYNYNREIYANTDGFAVVEPSNKGAYMTRSIAHAVANDDIFLQKDFDSIMVQIRKIMLKLMGISQQCAAQVIEDRTNIPRKIYFKQKNMYD